MTPLEEEEKNTHVIWFSWVFIISFFILDLLVPPEIAVGTLYVVELFILAQFGRHDRLLFFATLGVVLVIVDTFAAGPEAISWAILANRVMSILAIAVATFLLLQQQRLRDRDESKDILFRNLLESAPDAVVIVNEQGRIELTNRQTELMFGFQRKELIGRHVEMLIPKRYVDAHVSHRSSFFNAPQARTMGQNLELYALKSDGSEFPVEISLSPLETDDGLLVSAAIRDVSERREAEARFRDLLDSAPDATVIVDEDGRIQRVNRQTALLFGYEADELTGQEIEILMPTRFQVKHTGHRRNYFQTPKVRGMGQGLELYGRKKSGEEFPVEISLSPLETKEGLLVSAAIRDITERKQKERELNDYAWQLESKNRELEQFAYIASHDLQEPLRTVSSFVGLLVDEYRDKLEGDAETYLNYISDAANRMTQLINGLLDYSRIGARSELETVDCNQLLADIVTDLDRVIEDSGATVNWQDLPTLTTYANELRQLLQNLLSNAIKFRREGVAPIVTVAAERDQGKWRFSVADNGIGIEPQYGDQIFLLFQRLHTRQEYEGTGIGLAHCKKIVDLLGGNIWLKSTFGEGSTFYFTMADKAEVGG